MNPIFYSILLFLVYYCLFTRLQKFYLSPLWIATTREFSPKIRHGCGGLFILWLSITVPLTTLSSHPALWGLLGPISGFTLLKIVLGYLRHQRTRSLERNFLPLLSALRGFISVGYSLPISLSMATEASDAAIAKHLEKNLIYFKSGRSLERCLWRWKQSVRFGPLSTLLAALTLCDRRGLPALPTIDRALSRAEETLRLNDRLQDLSRSCLFQVSLCSLMPWVLCLCHWAFNPESWIRYRTHPFFWPTVGTTLTLEGVGGLLLWHLSRYR